MASMSALRPLSCARISAEELGVLLAGLLGSKAMAQSRVGDGRWKMEDGRWKCITPSLQDSIDSSEGED
jgi:hypothetical protein